MAKCVYDRGSNRVCACVCVRERKKEMATEHGKNNENLKQKETK